jgi:hypothetical protein
MQDDSGLRAQHHAIVQSSSGLHTSNATSPQALDGQQYRPWTAPVPVTTVAIQRGARLFTKYNGSTGSTGSAGEQDQNGLGQA